MENNNNNLDIRICEHEDVFQVPNFAFDYDLSARHLDFYIYLNFKESWNITGGSVKEMAEECDVSTNTVQLAKKKLVGVELIVTSRKSITLVKPMELKSGHYFELHRSVWENRHKIFKIKESAVVYSYLCRLANKNTQQCFPAMRTIGIACSLQWDKVNACLDELERLELIHKQARKKADNKWDDTYLFTLLKVDETRQLSLSEFSSEMNQVKDEFGMDAEITVEETIKDEPKNEQEKSPVVNGNEDIKPNEINEIHEYNTEENFTSVNSIHENNDIASDSLESFNNNGNPDSFLDALDENNVVIPSESVIEQQESTIYTYKTEFEQDNMDRWNARVNGTKPVELTESDKSVSSEELLAWLS